MRPEPGKIHGKQRLPWINLAAAAAWLGAAVAKLGSLIVDKPEPGKVIPGMMLDFLVGLALLAGYSAAT